jgi:MSHA pilin protein MshD
MKGRSHSRGVTLIELVVTITIVAIAVTGVVGALAGSAAQSADRMIQQQATAIASSYLEEIMQKPFRDPNANGEGARAQFDDVGDYNGLPDNVVRDQQGAAVAGLGQFQVRVQVGPGVLAGIPAAAVLLINVTVTHPSGVTVVMSGYKVG